MDPDDLRQACDADVSQMNRIRLSVSENVLTNPTWLTENRTRTFLNERGKGWVVEEGGRINGFAIVDGIEGSVWALFVRPGQEGRGIGRLLMGPAMDHLRDLGFRMAWLSTEPGTRAEAFYLEQGWTRVGEANVRGEVRMELMLSLF